MENVVKGWLLSLIGLVGIVVITLHATGIYKLPSPDVLSTTWEVIIGMVISFSLFLLPKTKIESAVESLFTSVINLFKKKTDA